MITIDRLAAYGIGIKTSTYFKLMYVLYSGDNTHYHLHTAVFGMN